MRRENRLSAARLHAQTLVLGDLAASDFSAKLCAQVERMVVARLNLTAGRVVGTDVARHAALTLGDERDPRNQLALANKMIRKGTPIGQYGSDHDFGVPY